jgi:hypothetical protein
MEVEPANHEQLQTRIENVVSQKSHLYFLSSLPSITPCPPGRQWQRAMRLLMDAEVANVIGYNSEAWRIGEKPLATALSS